MSFKVIDVSLWQSGAEPKKRGKKMDTIKLQKQCQNQRKSKVTEEKRHKKQKYFTPCWSLQNKHMQDANWVYYPFKNSHVFTWSSVPLNNDRQYLHKCMSCTIGEQKHKEKKEKKKAQ